MDREIFDVLVDLTRLPPASFASESSPLSKIFLQCRTAGGFIEQTVPPIALAILLKKPISQSRQETEYNRFLITKNELTKRYFQDRENFVPQNSMDKWLCFFERFSPEDTQADWTPIEQDLDDLLRMTDFDIGMKIWKAIHQSEFEESLSSIIWLHYFYRYAVQSQDSFQVIEFETPGICEPRLSTEKMVILAMNDIEHKPEWKKKVRDETIIAKWREECVTQKGFTNSMFDWMIEALRFKAESKDKQTGIEMAPPTSVFQSDSLVDENLRTDLLQGFSRLLQTDSRLYDWHPGSSEMVLDLVHPSMYCLALRRSYLIDLVSEKVQKDPLSFARAFLTWFKGYEDESVSSVFDEKVKTLRGESTAPSEQLWMTPSIKMNLGLSHGYDERQGALEHKYQWLPSDIRINAFGKATLLSYINNLKDGSLEQSLEELVTNFVPLFERALAFQNAQSLQHNVHGLGVFGSFRPEGFNEMDVNEFFDLKSVEEFQEWKEKQIREGKEIPPCPPNPYLDQMGEDEEEYEEDVEIRHWQSVRTFVPPEVKPFVAPVMKDSEWTKLKGSTIQIIFKLASVELTPEKPEYEGGVWHVEGTYSEQICATGIYYLDSSNITDPTLQFRRKIDDQFLTEFVYEQDDHEPMNRLFGDINDGTSAAQKSYIDLGYVSTPGKRAIVFPNAMQHKLSPFKLIDPTKPGYRRMIVMFLVHPFNRITSTAEISPQQCYEREAALAFGVKIDQLGEIKFGNLPFDVSHMITEEIMGKSEKAFSEMKTIVKEDDEKAAKRPTFEELQESRQRDRRIEIGEGTKEDLEKQRLERCRKPVAFSAPMTFKEACWHRERLMQDRSMFLVDPKSSDDDEGWNLCEH